MLATQGFTDIILFVSDYMENNILVACFAATVKVRLYSSNKT